MVPPQKDLATDVFKLLLAIAAGDPNGTAKNSTLRRKKKTDKGIDARNIQETRPITTYCNHSSLQLLGLQTIVFLFLSRFANCTRITLLFDIFCGTT